MKPSPLRLRHVQVLFEAGAMGTLADRDLLSRFSSGETGSADLAFEALVARHGPMVFRVCREVVRDSHAAQDACQAVFLILARKAKGIGRPELLGNWLFGVARKVAHRAKSQEDRRRLREARASRSREQDHSEPPDGLEWLHDEVSRLPERYRAPVVLCYLEGMSYDDAAQSLGVSNDAIRGRLARARERLRVRLERRGAGLAPILGLAPRSSEWASIVERLSKWSGGAVSPEVSSLVEGVLRTMEISKLKATLLATASAGMLMIGATVFAHASGTPLGALADPVEADEPLAKLVQGKIVRASTPAKDAMILSYLPAWDHGDVDNLGVGNNNGGVRTLVELPEVSPEDLAVPGRKFALALYSRKTTAGGPAGPILMFDVAKGWPERTSWDDQPDYALEPSASTPFEPGEGWKLFDVSKLVRTRTGKEPERHGVLLRFLSEDRSDRRANFSAYQFVSREGEGDWGRRRPTFLVIDPPKTGQ